MPEGSERPDDEPFIRLDELSSFGPPRTAPARTIGPARSVFARIGSPSALESVPAIKTAKIRVFNSNFIVEVLLAVVSLILLGVSLGLVAGPRSVGEDWLLVALSLALAAFALGDITWGMCVVVTRTEVIVRRHYTARRVSIHEIESAEVFERLLSFKPVVEVDLNTVANGRIRTPLVGSRSLSGRYAVEQVCRALNFGLDIRRSA